MSLILTQRDVWTTRQGSCCSMSVFPERYKPEAHQILAGRDIDRVFETGLGLGHVQLGAGRVPVQ
ncbi:MAG: hypothetical protein Ct9H300mP25_13030 [Acidobacteriota bacterium]|nr:MAG: hypothetical protein Ct9H300mP25_13030 [Acidobacteriota bacterium]